MFQELSIFSILKGLKANKQNTITIVKPKQTGIQPKKALKAENRALLLLFDGY